MLRLDPHTTAGRLGLDGAFANSIDAVSDRDFVQEFVADATILGTHLSRLAADILRWTDESLGWSDRAHVEGVVRAEQHVFGSGVRDDGPQQLDRGGRRAPRPRGRVRRGR